MRWLALLLAVQVAVAHPSVPEPVWQVAEGVAQARLENGTVTVGLRWWALDYRAFSKGAPLAESTRPMDYFWFAGSSNGVASLTIEIHHDGPMTSVMGTGGSGVPLSVAYLTLPEAARPHARLVTMLGDPSFIYAPAGSQEYVVLLGQMGELEEWRLYTLEQALPGLRAAAADVAAIPTWEEAMRLRYPEYSPIPSAGGYILVGALAVLVAANLWVLRKRAR